MHVCLYFFYFQRSGKIIAMSQEPQLHNLSPSKSWLSWGYQKLVKSPVTWSLKYLKSADSANTGARYIVVDILKVCTRLFVVLDPCFTVNFYPKFSLT